jgi:Fe2+ transport system protein FeoA
MCFASSFIVSPAESVDLDELLRLDQLSPRAGGTVARVDGDGDDVGRLQVMGVCVGRKVELIRPGDPLILRVLGSRLGLSARLARRVYVRACVDPASPSPSPPAQSSSRRG